MEIQATVVFQKNLDALNSGTRYIVNEGGSRSSKTYSLCQMFIIRALTNPREVTSIVRKTFPSLRATVYRDFVEVLQNMGIYDKAAHNKTEHIYTFSNGSMIEFFSVDEEQKIRGRKRTHCWINEANELFYEDYVQLNMRTSGTMLFDLNPSESRSWVYELPEKEKTVIHSTYKDNPFLEENIIRAIESLKETDSEMYDIYALGKRVTSRLNIYNSWTFIESKPERFQSFLYGLDFGFNHPTALVKVWYFETEIFIEPLIYQSYLTAKDLIDVMKELEVDQMTEIRADHARPEMIDELLDAGFNVLKANKEVKKGIDAVKTFKVYAKDDKDLRKEYENYKWKKIKDIISDEPIKLFDDAMDAIRYASITIHNDFVRDSAYETL